MERERAIGLAFDQSIEHASVVHCHHNHAIIGTDRGAGIDDVFEQVIDVVAARAGQVGADLAAIAVELVARAADPVVGQTPVAAIRAGKRPAIELLLEPPDALAAIGSRNAELAPDIRKPLFERSVARADDLTRVKHREIAAGNLAGGDLIEQGAGESRARDQGFK